MDRIRGMEVFVQVVDNGSMAAAASTLSLSPAMVSTYLTRLEAQLGVRLLNRTTRSLGVTDEGASYYAHCRHILAEIAEMDGALAGLGSTPRGRLKIDMPSTIARYLVLPLLPAFCARYPDIQIDMNLTERAFESSEEGYDLLVRLGPLEDSSMIARRLGATQLWTVASPAYLEKYGEPKHPSELHQHTCINYVSPRTGRIRAWEFEHAGARHSEQMKSALAFSQGDIRLEAALLGMGIMQAMAFQLNASVQAGRLQPILTGWGTLAPPIMVLYPQGRQHSPKVRAFADLLSSHYPPDKLILASLAANRN